MNRKTLLVGLSVLAVMFVGIAVLIAILYGGDGVKDGKPQVRKSEALFCAVPSNAVAVTRFADVKTASEKVLSLDEPPAKGRGGFGKAVADAVAAGRLPELSTHALAVSLQYSKNLVPLYVFDAGRAGDTENDAEVNLIATLASEAGLSFNDCDCSKILSVTQELRGRRLLLVSPADNIVNSSLRHLNDGVSIYDSNGFAAAASGVSASSSLFISVSAADQILPSVLSPSIRKHYKFLTSFSEWIGAELSFGEKGVELYGKAFSARQTDFENVLVSQKPASCNVFSIAPANTLRALSLPMDSYSGYVAAYDEWLDKRMKLQEVQKNRKALASAHGVSPADWGSGLRPSEIAVVSFICGDKIESVNLLRSSKLKNDSDIQSFTFGGYMAALFGDVFSREDESCSFSSGGWLITGSREAVGEWASGRALEYSLYSKLGDAGLKSAVPSSGNAVLYFSVDEDSMSPEPAFGKTTETKLAGKLGGCDIMPAFLCLSSEKKSALSIDCGLFMADMKRSKAPETERDVHITVPEGPFTVKNSATGKNNSFVQNQNLTLSLRDENGKGMWTVPFSEKLCGTVSNVDYFANGKIQFLFGAGSKIYMIDRLGRFVNPFPLDLGKKIVLGPAVFDFSGARKYNILVLHDDNTIRMYNLQGKVPDGWKDITSTDTIVSLPERVVSGNNSCWIVRTSRQTLVFPFMGGVPLTDFSGDAMLLPSTDVSVTENGEVSAKSYNGKIQRIKIR